MTGLARVIVTRWLAAALLVAASATHAQQLEPRAFAPNPVGVRFVSLSTGHTEGDVLLDAASPIEDFRVSFNDAVIGYARTFALWQRVASFGIALPYVTADADGVVDGEARSVSRSGLGDLRLRLTTSLLSDSALDPGTFARHPPGRTLGLSLVVLAPTGEHLEDKFVNIGSNRWAFKPELGGSLQFGRWNFDGSIGVWLFTDNSDYLSGSTRSQEPIAAVQGHVSYSFAPRLWLGLSVTQYNGGRTEIDGRSNGDSQNNSRAGLTLALPIGMQHSVKLSWGEGTSTRAGGDFTSFHVSWQYLWFD